MRYVQLERLHNRGRCFEYPPARSVRTWKKWRPGTRDGCDFVKRMLLTRRSCRFVQAGVQRWLYSLVIFVTCPIYWITGPPGLGAENNEQKSKGGVGGVSVVPGYPDAFAFGYQVADDSLSPDGKYGVIYADATWIDESIASNFLVALNPFRILAVNEGAAYYTYNAHSRRQIEVEWVKDNSAVLVGVYGKWGLLGLNLFELRDGHVTRRTNLFAEIERLLDSRFPRTKVEPYNDTRRFIFDRGQSEKEHEWHFEGDDQHVHIYVFGTNNPKPMEPPIKTWSGRLDAVWNIREGRWLTKKVRTSIYRQ